MLNVGTNIFQCRLRRGYTQAELALKCENLQPKLSNIAKVKLVLTHSTLVRIAAALGTRPVQLIEEERQKRPRLPFNRRTMESIALAAVDPRAKVSSEIRGLASLFREVLPETGSGSIRKATHAWTELKQRFTSGEIRGICQRMEDALQRKP